MNRQFGYRVAVSQRWKAVLLYDQWPVANWDEQGGRNLDDFLRNVFNSDQYQEIRTELAAGRLPLYCRESLGCPVLKRMSDRHDDPIEASAVDAGLLAESF